MSSRIHHLGHFGLTVLAVASLGLVACGGSGSDDTASGSGAVSAGDPAPTIPTGAYQRIATGNDGRSGTLTVSAASDASLTFDLDDKEVIGADEDPGQAGTHEGGTNGVAPSSSDGAYTFKGDGDCVIHFQISTPTPGKTRITVKQDENTVCEPDPLISMDGDYEL